MGRPTFEPTDEQRKEVASLVQARVSLVKIAKQYGITTKTLRKAFAVELGLEELGKNDREKTPDREKTLPPFKPTAEQREVVAILAGAKIITRDEIAEAIEVSVEVLEAHFQHELTVGALKKHHDVILSIQRAAVGGNMSAAGKWMAITAPGDRKGSGRAGADGKKAMAQERAREIGGGGGRFATPAPPKLIVDNGKK